MDTVGSQQLLKKVGAGVFGIVVTLVGFMISAPAGASDVSVRGASCTLVRYYVARYSVPAAEAWARSKGATEVEIDKARRCIHTAQVGRNDRAY